MHLTELQKLTWSPSLMSKAGPDSGLVTMKARIETNKKKNIEGKDLFLEFRWNLVKKVDEPTSLKLNTRKPITTNFHFEIDPDNPITIIDFTEALPWRNYVKKILPEDTFK